MGRQKLVSVLAVFAMIIAMSGMASAAVPDKLLVSEQPETLDADGVSCTDITVQLVAEYDNGDEEPVKMCGIEVQCESQNPNILHASTGGSTAIAWTDEFGKAKMEFCSTGSEEYNIGDVQVICRAIQLEEDSSIVHVLSVRGELIEATMCPQSGYYDLSQEVRDRLEDSQQSPEFVLDDALADIIADGESHVYVTGQIKGLDCDEELVPVKKAGVMRFKSLDTSIVKTCEPAGTVYYNMQGQKMTVLDDGAILVETDNGVAMAEFCSTGDGSENVGTATIVIESVDYLNVVKDEIEVTTTSQYGTTYKDGYLAMSAMPSQILADGESCLKACAQTRDQDYRIIRKPDWEVSFESDDTNIVEALYPTSPTDAGLTSDDTDDEGIAIAEYCSAGTFDGIYGGADNTGTAVIRGAMMYIAELGSVSVDAKTSQIWPVDIEATATMDMVNCDGVSTVTVTGQLLDRCDLAVKMAGRLINFKSHDTSLLTPGVISVATDEFGKANATFTVSDCKYANADEVEIEVSTMSPEASDYVDVEVVKPHGFVPDGVNVYTDHNALVTSHAKPYVIAADGDSPIELTAQVCEWEPDRCVGTRGNSRLVDCDNVNKWFSWSAQLRQQICLSAGCTWDPQDTVCSGFSDRTCAAFDGNERACSCFERCTYGFCNPVKRCGMEVQFEIEDTHVVENVHDNVDAIEGTHDGDAYPSYVKMLTDDEGTATIILRSTGDAPTNKNICTQIKVTGKDGVIFEDEAYAEVCTKGYAGMHPNALWVWAEPAYITADGISHTTVRTALYYCYDELPTISKTLDQQNDYDYLFENCKPVKKSGVTVKFETLNTDALDDGMGGYKIYDITDEYGQAHATFQSKGFDKQHMGPAEIEAWTIGSGEDVIQLNTLIVGLEEKTWPWCPPYSAWFEEGSPEATADVDHDQYITDNELIEYIMNVWMNSYHPIDNPYGQDDAALIQVIVAWLTQL